MKPRRKHLQGHRHDAAGDVDAHTIEEVVTGIGRAARFGYVPSGDLQRAQAARSEVVPATFVWARVKLSNGREKLVKCSTTAGQTPNTAGSVWWDARREEVVVGSKGVRQGIEVVSWERPRTSCGRCGKPQPADPGLQTSGSCRPCLVHAKRGA